MAAARAAITLPALTAGSVLFNNGSDIAQDNGNFFWDDNNKRLGLGTNAPGNELDVRGYGSFGDGTYGLQLGP